MNTALSIQADPRGALVVPHHHRATSDRLDLSALLSVIWRRMTLFVCVAAFVFAAAVVITARQTPLYSARVELIMDPRQDHVAPRSQQDQAVGDPDRTDTEVQVLLSREIAAHVVDSLDLAHNVNFNPRLQPDRSLVAGLARLIGRAAPVRLTANTVGPRVKRDLIDRLIAGTRVTRQAETRAVEISVTVPSAADAARIANQYARQYTGGQLQAKLRENRDATSFLASRLEELRAQAQVDTQHVQQYRIANNLLSTSGASLTEQEISSYNQAVANARAQSAEDEARVGTAQSQLRNGSSGDDVGEALNSSVVSGMRARQAEISGQLADLQSHYGDNHPDVVKTRTELADLDNRIAAEIKRVISNLQAKRQVSGGRLSSLSGSLGNAKGALQQNNRAMAGLDDLVRRAQASQELYESYLNRYKETVAAGGTERADATVISWAETPLAPTSPKWTLSLILGAVIGLGAGLSAAFIAEMIFSGLTTGEDVEDRLGLPYLAGIPSLASLRPRRRIAPEDAVAEPRTAFSEAFQALCTSLNYVTPPRPQVVAITSALPKEGKSTIAICLARAMATEGKRVLLIDCDMVRATLSRKLNGAHRARGLIELLNGEATLDEVRIIDEGTGMHVLPLSSERAPPGDFANIRLVELINGLRPYYDQIVIDTAPLLPIAATRMICAMADATIIVARWRHTPDHAVKAALRLLPPEYVNVAGAVLSRINMKRQAHYGRGDASFYYNRYQEYYK